MNPNVAVLVAISLMGIAACRAMSGVLMYIKDQTDKMQFLATYLEEAANPNRGH